MSRRGPSRHFAAPQQLRRFRSKADIDAPRPLWREDNLAKRDRLDWDPRESKRELPNKRLLAKLRRLAADGRKMLDEVIAARPKPTVP
jgi:hypothetical protein